MYGQWTIVKGDQVFIQAKDAFYKPFLCGWFTVNTTSPEKDRFTMENNESDEGYKMFRNKQGICCVVEHECDKYGESTWDDVKEQYRFIFVPVDLYVKTSR